MANVYVNQLGRMYQASAAASSKDQQIAYPTAELIAAAPSSVSPDYVSNVVLKAVKVRTTNNPNRIT
jgi:hypothetical protein